MRDKTFQIRPLFVNSVCTGCGSVTWGTRGRKRGNGGGRRKERFCDCRNDSFRWIDRHSIRRSLSKSKNKQVTLLYVLLRLFLRIIYVWATSTQRHTHTYVNVMYLCCHRNWLVGDTTCWWFRQGRGGHQMYHHIQLKLCTWTFISSSLRSRKTCKEHHLS